MLQEIFANILELPTHKLLDEPRHKFENTWMILNGELKYIEQIQSDYLIVSGSDFISRQYDDADVVSLAPWIPERGMYDLGYGAINLYRLTEKQWKKSFAWSWFAYTNLGPKSIESQNAPYEIFGKTPKQFIKIKNSFYFRGQKLQDISLVKQEIQDYLSGKYDT